MTRARIQISILFAVLALSSVSLSGCTGEPPKGPVQPGVDEGFLGGREVVGYLTESNGDWTVFDADSDTSAGSEPEALATLVPGSVDEGGIEALDGRYVWAAGRSSDGEAGTPEIMVDGIDTAVEPP